MAEQVRGMPASRFAGLVTGEHPGNLVDAILAGHDHCRCKGGARLDALADHDMRVGQRSHLRKMGDDQYLMSLAEGRQAHHASHGQEHHPKH